MQKIDISVSALTEMIERGELKLPEMQRRYVWRDSRVRDLFDSLYHGYPTGSILVWETEGEVPDRDLQVAQVKNPFSTQKLLLDGQQRLTSLVAVINQKPIKVRNRTRPIQILFNLDHPEGPPQEVTEVLGDDESPLTEEEETDTDGEIDADSTNPQERFGNLTFVVSNRNLENQPQWIPVSKIFQKDLGDWDLLRDRVSGPQDAKFALYSRRLQRLRSIRDYIYVMHVLGRQYSYQEVTEIFVRVNSLGVKLRGSDLALAQITSRWPGFLTLLEAFQAESEPLFKLDSGLLVRAMVVFGTQQSRFNTVGSVKIERLQTGWDEAKEGIRFAINFLRANAGIDDESLLSSPLLLLTVGVASHRRRGRLSRDEQRALLYWLHVANAKGHYSRGSSETVLDSDLRILFRGGGPADLIEPLRTQVGRLTVEPGDLTGRGVNNPLFQTVFLVLKASGAKDWHSGLGISLTHQGRSHFIQHHHIFPRSLLAKDGRFDKTMTNEIANLAFVSGGTNLRLSGKEPAVYFPEIIKRQGIGALESQAIPHDSQLYYVNEFPKFLEARRVLLAQRINSFIAGIRDGDQPAPIPDATELVRHGENRKVEFKSSLQWDHKNGRQNAALRMPVMKTIVAFLNSGGGTLLIGIGPDRQILGLREDIKIAKGSLDEFEQTLFNLVSRHIGVEFTPFVSIDFEDLKGETVCIVRVLPAPQPAYLTDGEAQAFYVRGGNASRPLDHKEAVDYVTMHWK
jgi:hypothetical protein